MKVEVNRDKKNGTAAPLSASNIAGENENEIRACSWCTSILRLTCQQIGPVTSLK